VSADELSLMMLKEMQVPVMTPMPTAPFFIPEHDNNKDGGVLLSIKEAERE
jgi:hypothetical protein